MNKIHFTPAAMRDLHYLEDYITYELHNPTAAKRIVQQITKQLRILERYNQAGLSLQAKIDIPTDLRVLICKAHLVFYRIEADGSVSISRILNARQDAMQIIFGNEPGTK